MDQTKMSLREEILGEMIKADFGGSIHSGNYGTLVENILKIFEKRIDILIQEDKNVLTNLLKPKEGVRIIENIATIERLKARIDRLIGVKEMLKC